MAATKYDRPDRPSPYGVRWVVDGKRKFKFFKKQADRNAFLLDLNEHEQEHGRSILRVSSAEAQVMADCVKLLGSASTVWAACLEYQKHHEMIKVPVEQALSEFLEEKQRMGRDANYTRSARNILRRAADFDGLPDPLSSWTREQALEFMMALLSKFEPVTVKNHVKLCSTFCRWAMQKRYLQANPFQDLPLPDILAPEPGIVSVEEMRKLLYTAGRDWPDAVAYIALNAFGGIRSSACARIGLDDIRFDERGILISARNAKNKRRIYIDGHPPVMWDWLEWARKLYPESFEMSKRLWDRRREQVSRDAGVKLPHNAFRHSFCSYHVALMGDAGRTATLLTHRGNVSILYNHYKGNASQKEAQAFFDLTPEAVLNR